MSKNIMTETGTDTRMPIIGNPRISIVTPSYGQGAFLPYTLRSVIDQRYPALEYIVIDGGSTDGSVASIEADQGALSFWCSEKDAGHYDAVNKGFARATGEIMAWINSDDIYCPWTLRTVAQIFTDVPEVEWLTSSTILKLNSHGSIIDSTINAGYTRSWFYRGRHLGDHPRCRGWIQQESTFWRRSLWLKAGGAMDTRYTVAADFDLWARFWRHAPLVATACPLAAFRIHETQRSRDIDRYYAEAHASLSHFQKELRCNPLAAWGAEQIFKFTGKTCARFGYGDAMLNVYYDRPAGKWRLSRTACV